MTVCYICDNETTANGAVVHASYDREDCTAIFVSLSESVTSFLQSKGIDAYELGVNTSGINGNGKKINRRLSGLIKFIFGILSFSRKKSLCCKMISEFKVKKLIVPSDRSHGNGFIMPFISAAKNESIPVCIIEYADFADEERLYQVRKLSLNRYKPDFLTRNFFPNWIIRSHSEKDIQLYPTYLLIIWKIFGCLSDDPKVVGMLHGVSVFVRNENTEQKLIEAGCKHVVKIDNFFVSEINNLVDMESDYDLAIGLPQLAEHGLCDSETARNIHINLLKALDDSNLSYLVLLHPKMNRKEYENLTNNYKGDVFDGSSHEGLLLADCFINTFSSLTHEAIQAGKNIHIFDPVDLGYTMFDAYRDITYSKNIKEFEDFLKDYKSHLNVKS
ncbi:hypothetical protein ACMXYR_02680 [Neptuniibacter sp. QD29_5]|uniref:hypothetical protein n=1 Tax=Neptuniibacter sp. QD29_5 TaxID=3398207 RepID=UPI0039F55557